MSDPWCAVESSTIGNRHFESQETEKAVLEFEDNFTIRQQNNPNNILTTTIGSNHKSNNNNNHNHSSSTVNGVGGNSSGSAKIGIEPLPDSDTYLQGLERKLRKLKKDSRLVEALAAKREDCFRSLLQQDGGTSTGLTDNAQLELDTPIRNGELSAVQEIYRHLQPVQAATVGETVHIVHYDQLEEQQQQQIDGEHSEEVE